MNAALDTTFRPFTLAGARLGIALLIGLAASACTTTVRQVGDAHPVSQNVQTHPPKEIDETRELRVAQTALQNGDADTATGIYNRILAKKPDSIPALIGLGNMLYMVSDYTRADVNFRKALALDPKATQALIGVARVAIQKRHLDAAIDAYRQILVIQPNEPLAAAGLGAALDMKGDHAAAQASMRQSLDANPGDIGLSINLGLSLVLDGKLKEGADMLQDAAHFPGAPPQARYDLALAYGLMGDDDTAARLLSDLPRKAIDDNLSYYASLRAEHQSASPARGAGVQSAAVPAAAAATAASQRGAPAQPIPAIPAATVTATRARYAKPVADAAITPVVPPLPAARAAAVLPVSSAPVRAPAAAAAPAIAAQAATPAVRVPVASAPVPSPITAPDTTALAVPDHMTLGGVIHGRLTNQPWNREASSLASQSAQVQP